MPYSRCPSTVLMKSSMLPNTCDVAGRSVVADLALRRIERRVGESAFDCHAANSGSRRAAAAALLELFRRSRGRLRLWRWRWRWPWLAGRLPDTDDFHVARL